MKDTAITILSLVLLLGGILAGISEADGMAYALLATAGFMLAWHYIKNLPVVILISSMALTALGWFLMYRDVVEHGNFR